MMPMLGFDYDSSYTDTEPYEPQPGGCCSFLPFFIGDLVELPITLPQDHTLFAVLGHQDGGLWIAKAREIRARGGMVLALSHPDYAHGPALEAWQQLLRDGRRRPADVAAAAARRGVVVAGPGGLPTRRLGRRLERRGAGRRPCAGPPRRGGTAAPGRVVTATAPVATMEAGPSEGPAAPRTWHVAVVVENVAAGRGHPPAQAGRRPPGRGFPCLGRDDASRRQRAVPGPTGSAAAGVPGAPGGHRGARLRAGVRRRVRTRVRSPARTAGPGPHRRAPAVPAARRLLPRRLGAAPPGSAGGRRPARPHAGGRSPRAASALRGR